MRTITAVTLAVAVTVAFLFVLGAVVALGGLLALAERPDGSTAFDSSITSWVVEHRAAPVTTLAKSLSTIGSQKVLTPTVLVVAGVLLWTRRFEPAVLLVAVWGGAILLYSLGKQLVERPRPPSHIWLTTAGGSAFPSGHAVQSLATFALLALVAETVTRRARPVARVLALLLAVGVGWSRIYLGVHWTTDVLAGWLAAGVWTATVIWLFARMRSPHREAQRG